jgi:Transposase, Mutator family.
MDRITRNPPLSLLSDAAGFDPIEERPRASVRAMIETMFEEEVRFLGRMRYGRGDGAAKSYRHGHRERQLTGTFGTETLRVPRVRTEAEAGKATEWGRRRYPATAG